MLRISSKIRNAEEDLIALAGTSNEETFLDFSPGRVLISAVCVDHEEGRVYAIIHIDVGQPWDEEFFPRRWLSEYFGRNPDMTCLGPDYEEPLL